MKHLACLALIGGLACGVADAAAPGGPNWIVDPAKGCGTSNPFPNPDDRIEWSGACRNGLLHGPGTLIWRQGGEEYERDEGTFVDGELDGPAVIRFPDGRAIHGSYSAGKRDGAFTVVLPDGVHIRATYRDGELVTEYQMNEREIAAWQSEPAAAPPPPRPVTTVTGKGADVRTSVAAAPPAPAATPPAPVDTGRPPRLGAPRPAATAPPSAPAARALPTTAPAPPRIVERPLPPPPSPPSQPSAPLVMREPAPTLPRTTVVAPPTVASAPSLPLRPLPPTTPIPAAVAPSPVVVPPPARTEFAALPARPERVGAIPIFGGGGLALRQPAETVVIGSDGRPLTSPPAAGNGIRLRAPGDVAAGNMMALADDLPPGRFNIDLRGASVEDAAAAVFGVLLDRPYSVAPGLGVPITLAPSRPVAAAELLASFRRQLNAAGADLRRTADGYAIVRN